MKPLAYIVVLSLMALVSFAQDTAVSDESAKNAEIATAIISLTGTCRSNIQSKMAASHDTLQQGCQKIERFRHLLFFIGCGSDDYAKLHAVLCYVNGVYVN